MDRIVKAEYLAEYRILVTFRDGKSGVLNTKPVLESDLRPVFLELLNLDLFRSFRGDMDTIVWNNGLDLAPEFIRENTKDENLSYVGKIDWKEEFDFKKERNRL
jgi:hypothetical protein